MNLLSVLNGTFIHAHWVFSIFPGLLVSSGFLWFSLLGWTISSVVWTILVVVFSETTFFGSTVLNLHYTNPSILNKPKYPISTKKGCRNSYNKADCYKFILLLRVFAVVLKSFLLFLGIPWYVVVVVTKLCPTFCNSMGYSLPGTSVHEISQARILEWVAISFSRVSSQPRDRTGVSHIAGRCFTIWATRETMTLLFRYYFGYF